MNVSRKNILEIREFMWNFLNLKYDGKLKLTHEEFSNYLIMKGKTHLTHANFKKIKKEDILNGTYILVRDDVGKIIPYERPINLSMLCNQIKQNEEKLKRDLIRKRYLEEQGYRELPNGEVLSNDFFEAEPCITQKLNRVKTLIRRGIR